MLTLMLWSSALIGQELREALGDVPNNGSDKAMEMDVESEESEPPIQPLEVA